MVLLCKKDFLFLEIQVGLLMSEVWYLQLSNSSEKYKHTNIKTEVEQMW